MAGLAFTAPISSSATTNTAISLSAATFKTVLVITAAANQRVKLTGFNISFNGTVNSNTPVAVSFQAATVAGTATSMASALRKKEPGLTETIQTTVGSNCTVEPTYTASAFPRMFFVHPQLGQEIYLPQGQEIWINGGGILGIGCNAPQAVSVSGFVDLEE